MINLSYSNDKTHYIILLLPFCTFKFIFLIVDGSWSSWHSWSSCDRTCGNGTQTRTRDCGNPAPQDGGMSCPGVNHETNVCKQGKCPGMEFVVI